MNQHFHNHMSWSSLILSSQRSRETGCSWLSHGIRSLLSINRCFPTLYRFLKVVGNTRLLRTRLPHHNDSWYFGEVTLWCDYKGLVVLTVSAKKGNCGRLFGCSAERSHQEFEMTNTSVIMKSWHWALLWGESIQFSWGNVMCSCWCKPTNFLAWCQAAGRSGKV